MPQLTHILQAASKGDPHAAEQLLPIVYQELRRLAAHKMARENPGHTLQPTALVHEAWLKLVGQQKQNWKDRNHFFATASEAMRRILIDNIRRKRSQRHGGGQQRVELDSIEIPEEAKTDDLLALNDALDKLAVMDKPKAELVKLRFFVGLNIEEAADVLGISVPTAKRYWAFARAWLYEEIKR